MNQQQCDFQSQQMTTLARTPDDRKKASETAKIRYCTKGVRATACERQICLNACTYLNDSMCLMQINNTIRHGPPPPPY